jgi:hypothetical protein
MRPAAPRALALLSLAALGCVLPEYRRGLTEASAGGDASMIDGSSPEASGGAAGQDDAGLEGAAAAAGGAGAGGSSGEAGLDGSAGLAGSAGCTGSATDRLNCGLCGRRCVVGEVCTGGSCVAVETTQLVTVPIPGGGSHGIDRTEVTKGQYYVWLLTNPMQGLSQGPYCAFSFTAEPACEWPPGAADLKRPVVCVNWCQAYAYCTSIGKRLCGDAAAGSVAFFDYAKATRSQWMNACSAGGKYVWCYGASEKPDACNGALHAAQQTLDVGTMPDCHSPDPAYAGVFDLSGNVWEWEDCCESWKGSADTCRIRGGSFANYSGLMCNNDTTAPRSGAYENAGFRCCSVGP